MSQYTKQKNELLSQLPPEFIEFVEIQAYRRAYHDGQDKIDMIAVNIASELVPTFKKFVERVIDTGDKP
jgi:hypothetical protein